MKFGQLKKNFDTLEMKCWVTNDDAFNQGGVCCPDFYVFILPKKADVCAVEKCPFVN